MKRTLAQTQEIQRDYKKPMLQRSQSKSLANPYRKPGLAVEKKNYDYLDVNTSTTGNAFSNFNSLFEPIVGTTSEDRIGRKTTMRSLYVRGVWVPASNACDLRIVVYYDKQCNSAIPALAQAFTGPPHNFNSFTNLNNSERFIIIADEIFNQADTANDLNHFQFYRKLNLDAVFNDSTILPNTGGLFIAFCANSSATTAITYSARVRFTDVY